MDIKKVVEEVSALDMGVLVTKAQDLVGQIDFDYIPNKINDLRDNPKVLALKSSARVLRDFAGWVCATFTGRNNL